MSDIDRGHGPRYIEVEGEDRLPWLEAVDEDERGRGPGAGKLLAAILVALLAVGLVVGGVFWLRDRGRAPGSGDLIAAPEKDYKVKPTDAGGMKVEGEGDTAFAASDGKETNASINLSAIPETPVAGAGSVTSADAATSGAVPKPAPVPVKAAPAPAPVKPAPVVAHATKPVVPAPAAKAPAPTAVAKAAPVVGGTQIQLGAFSSEAKAKTAWKTLATRFGFLSGLTESVTPVTSGDKTLYRLRAPAGAQANAICAKLKIAGESCSIIG